MTDKIININDTIKELLPIAKQAIKDFYGEKYESIIEERFKNVTVVGYITPKEIERRLNSLFNNKSNELKKRFLRENNIEVNKENIKMYFSIYSLSTPNLQNINMVYQYQERETNNQYETNNILKILRKITGNESLEPNTKDFYQALDKVNKLKDSYERILKEYNDYKAQYQEYSNYIDSCKKLEDIILNKYNRLFLNEIKEYLSEHDKELIKEEKLNIYKLDCYRLLINGIYSFPTLIDSFSLECDEQLKDENNPSYIKDSIISDRINYFKGIGIDLGDNYDDYINNPKVQEKYPSKKMVDKIMKLRKILSQKQKEEYIESTTKYQEQLKEIESLNLLDKNHSYNPREILNRVTCINPNIRKDETSYSLYSLLLFSASHAIENEYFDVRLIHELNHLVELSKFTLSEDRYEVLCGFDMVNSSFSNNEEDDQEKREYELFNEIINELIAQEITTMMHSNGIYLLSDKEKAKIKYGTSYEKNKVIVSEFYETYKEEIIESRLTGDMEVLYNKVGKENIIKLNELVNQFSNSFPEFTFYRLNIELQEKQDTENTRKFYELIEKRNIILDTMSIKADKSNKKIS